ncbi:MAG: hypothetical protein IIB59_02945 [Planctomycetes bacterium]|nr:hypothetical protein [Planctomycetota bacterium]
MQVGEVRQVDAVVGVGVEGFAAGIVGTGVGASHAAWPGLEVVQVDRAITVVITEAEFVSADVYLATQNARMTIEIARQWEGAGGPPRVDGRRFRRQVKVIICRSDDSVRSDRVDE